MLDIGWPELFLIAVVALIVVGPKDLPRALQTVGRWVRALRGMAGEFQRHVDDMVRETDLQEARDQLRALKPGKIGQAIESQIDPDGGLKKDLGRVTAPAASAAKAQSQPVSGGSAPAPDAPPPQVADPPPDRAKPAAE